MTIEVSLLIAVVSVIFGIYSGWTSMKRNQCTDARNDASEMTTVIVKLENINTGITEIKSEMSNVKKESSDSRERIIKVEESAKQAHKRIDTCEKYCKRFSDASE